MSSLAEDQKQTERLANISKKVTIHKHQLLNDKKRFETRESEKKENTKKGKFFLTFKLANEHERN